LTDLQPGIILERGKGGKLEAQGPTKLILKDKIIKKKFQKINLKEEILS
jgi:hypothetical protein